MYVRTPQTVLPPPPLPSRSISLFLVPCPFAANISGGSEPILLPHPPRVVMLCLCSWWWSASTPVPVKTPCGNLQNERRGHCLITAYASDRPISCRESNVLFAFIRGNELFFQQRKKFARIGHTNTRPGENLVRDQPVKQNAAAPHISGLCPNVDEPSPKTCPVTKGGREKCPAM